MTVYRYTVEGTDAGDQMWTVTGDISSAPGNFAGVAGIALAEAFEKLTQGRALFGQPGVGCKGPYRIRRLAIELAPQ